MARMEPIPETALDSQAASVTASPGEAHGLICTIPRMLYEGGVWLCASPYYHRQV